MSRGPAERRPLAVPYTVDRVEGMDGAAVGRGTFALEFVHPVHAVPWRPGVGGVRFPAPPFNSGNGTRETGYVSRISFPDSRQTVARVRLITPCSSSAAWAAARRAMGTRNGEQDT